MLAQRSRGDSEGWVENASLMFVIPRPPQHSSPHIQRFLCLACLCGTYVGTVQQYIMLDFHSQLKLVILWHLWPCSPRLMAKLPLEEKEAELVNKALSGTSGRGLIYACFFGGGLSLVSWIQTRCIKRRTLPHVGPVAFTFSTKSCEWNGLKWAVIKTPVGGVI